MKLLLEYITSAHNCISTNNGQKCLNTKKLNENIKVSVVNESLVASKRESSRTKPAEV